jgi:hypothetical protein
MSNDDPDGVRQEPVQRRVHANFIRIGSLYLRISDILEVDANYQGNCVRIMMRGVDAVEGFSSSSRVYVYNHDTPEAAALVAWLEPQTLDLLAEPCEEDPIYPDLDSAQEALDRGEKVRTHQK